ncbi:MAG: TlpA family protein disulfide reductase [Anaerolineales bacterium]|nr:TlpA family protein disulfide reductase [Anaerolineales bacterium]MCX7754883.1 TlpA family protein disulfide reductase [Anaerolineales bacterium]MDW8279298.1 TlpA disulfide reductase family protein [Anaerolineales bacterium]
MRFNQQAITYSLILLAGLLWIGFSAAPQGSTTSGKIPAPQAGFLSPDFTLTTLNGETIRLFDLRGRVILLNIWASWCPPCRAEMPAMQRVWEEYRAQGVVVLAVNATSQDTLADAQAFVAENGLTFPIPLDTEGEVTRLYRVSSLPTSFFIGADGVIREVVIGGPMAEALLRSRIEELLQEMR